MTKEEKSRYSEPEALRDILKRVLSGRKFLLDCGHYAENIVMRREASQI
jgi:hypothetical protein